MSLLIAFKMFGTNFSRRPFPFLVNIDITTTGEIDTFERTGMIFARLVNLRSTQFTFFADQQCLPGCSSLISSTEHSKQSGSPDVRKQEQQSHHPDTRMQDVSPRVTDCERFTAPVNPQMTYPPSHSRLEVRNTFAKSICLLYNGDSHARKPSASARLNTRSTSRSRRCPTCSNMIYVSAYYADADQWQ